MRSRFFFSLVVSFGLLFAFGSVVAAQTWTPDVQVDDDGVVDGAVIHADDGGNPGPVIGHAPLAAGENLQVVVEVESEAVTPVLHAMLHVDAGETGVFEFPGDDVPITIGKDIVMAQFSAAPPVLPASGGATSPLLILTVVTLILFAFGGSVLFSSRLALSKDERRSAAGAQEGCASRRLTPLRSSRGRLGRCSRRSRPFAL